MNDKTEIVKEVLELIDHSNGYILLNELYDKFSNKYSRDVINEVLDNLELMDCVLLTVNSRGRDIVEITKTGKKYLRVLKGATLCDKIINAIIYNPIIRRILGLDI